MTARSDLRALLHHDALPLPIEVRAIRGAKRLRLRLGADGDRLTLTMPARMARAEALHWAAQQHRWVETQMRSRLPAEPFVPGAKFPIDGREVELCWAAGEPRTPRLDDNRARLICGGPIESFARRIEKELRRFAQELLAAETRTLADTAGLAVASVSVGDAAARWGSCSSSGRIRYSWRLILAPVEARKLVVAHEVAHLAHLDHGPQFKALETRLFGGDPKAARALLRSSGPRLRRFGRSD